MAQHMRRDALGVQRGAAEGGPGGMPGDEASDCAAADRGAAPGGEQRVAGTAAAFFHPGGEHRRGLLAQRGAAALTALAVAAEMSAGAQLDVAVAQPG